jgi:hypothetical protein
LRSDSGQQARAGHGVPGDGPDGSADAVGGCFLSAGEIGMTVQLVAERHRGGLFCPYRLAQGIDPIAHGRL